VAEATIHPSRRLVSAKDEVRAEEMAHSREAELADVQIAARDETTLSAWTIRPRNSNGKAIILLHGLSDNRLGMIGYAEMLLGHGFSVLAPDARAHGASGGQLATYVCSNRRTFTARFDWLPQNQHPGCIFGFCGIHGSGTALAIAASRTALLRCCCGIAFFKFP